MRITTTIILVLFLATVGSPAFAESRPNILWITVEDMSPTLGCWGDDYATTPNIDKFAQRAVRYTNAFATASVCSPARSTIITGCYATSLGTQRLRSGFKIPEAMKGFPALLRQAGYYCSNNVKTDYNASNAKDIVKASWNESGNTAHWRNRKDNQPFFAVFNYTVTHQSRTMAWPYDKFKAEVQSQLTPSEIHSPDDAPVPPYYPDTPVVRKTLARYYDCVTVMDKQVGALLDQLEEDGLTDDTIVFFYSDHGSGMPRHKRLLLDSGMHVPMLIHFPEEYRHLAPADPGEDTGRLVSFVDFGPTALSLCGVDIPEVMQGMAFLGKQAGAPRSFVYGARDRVDEAFDVARSVRNDQYLYIRNFMPHISYNQPSSYSDQSEIRQEIYRVVAGGKDAMTPAQWHYAGPNRPPEELYDVQSDPMNLNNLADTKEHAELLANMRVELKRWMLDTNDVGFLPESEAEARSKGKAPFEWRTDPKANPLEKLIQAASLVGNGQSSIDKQIRLLKDPDDAVRYWGCLALAAQPSLTNRASKALTRALNDQAACVRIEAAGALAKTPQRKAALDALAKELESTNLTDVLHAARTVELLDERAISLTDPMRNARTRAAGKGNMNMYIRFSVDAFIGDSE